MIVYTLVHPELREALRALCRRYKLHYCDLLGHPIDAVARSPGVAAQDDARARAPPLDSAYFKRIAAIEFAVKYDDGVGAGLHEADIVLVGVSRTSKTPLSMYLGYLGYKTANVPIVKGIEPPRGALRGRPDEDRRPDDRRRAARGDPQAARAPARRQPSAPTPSCSRSTRSSRRPSAPPAARLPGDRDLRPLDRGDGRAGDPARRAAAGRGRDQEQAPVRDAEAAVSRSGAGRSGG